MKAIFEAKPPPVGSLNMCQKGPYKILKASNQYLYSVQRKHPKCHKKHRNGPIWPLFWCFLILVQSNCPHSFCIFSDISWDNFRVPTTNTFEGETLFENWGFRVILGDCGCKYFLRDIKIYMGHICTIWVLIIFRWSKKKNCKMAILLKNGWFAKKVMFYLILSSEHVFVNF